MKTLFNVFFLLVATALAANGDQDDKISKPVFSDWLAQYSSLASCFALIHEDFAYCNKKAEEKGKAYLEGYDENSEWAKRGKCCGTWELRDCWVKFAKQKCDAMQAEQVHNLPYAFIKNLDEMCKDYSPNSYKCRFTVRLMEFIFTKMSKSTKIWS